MFKPVTLSASRVTLTPLTEAHIDQLWLTGNHAELWKLAMNLMETKADMERYVRTALAEQAAGTSVPFATSLTETGEIIGSTRFGNIEPLHRRVEIGWTWITPPYQRTFVNTQAKVLMLKHAFEFWNVNRVELKTDALNMKSRNAMLRIGAKEEAVMREHLICESGRIRDTAYYSILKSEWPRVKAGLESKLAQ